MQLEPDSVLGFPEVRFVDRIPGPHPMARFICESSPQKIEFSRAECSKLISHETLLFIVCHELGHWCRTNYMELGDILGWNPGEGFLIFGAVNSEEGFANAFAAFIMGDLDLEAHYPEQHAMLAGLLAGHEEELRGFSDHTCGWLAEQLQERGNT